MSELSEQRGGMSKLVQYFATWGSIGFLHNESDILRRTILSLLEVEASGDAVD